MTKTLTAVLSAFVLSLAFAAVVQAQTDATPAQAQTPARVELKAGTSAYRDGRFVEAEQHFRRALELDPARKDVLLFLARAIQQQYKPSDESAESVATGERAVRAYRDILNGDPQNEEAYKAILHIYVLMKREDKVVEALTERANDANVSEEKRAEALVVLASKQWQCSYDITERGVNRTRDAKSGTIVYHMPADPVDFATARQCTDTGLQFIEQAVSLNPNSSNAWVYKASLLREASKLAEMEGSAEQKEEFERQYEEAVDAHKRAGAVENPRTQERQKPPAREELPPPPPPTPPIHF